MADDEDGTISLFGNKNVKASVGLGPEPQPEMTEAEFKALPPGTKYEVGLAYGPYADYYAQQTSEGRNPFPPWTWNNILVPVEDIVMQYPPDRAYLGYEGYVPTDQDYAAMLCGVFPTGDRDALIAEHRRFRENQARAGTYQAEFPRLGFVWYLWLAGAALALLALFMFYG